MGLCGFIVYIVRVIKECVNEFHFAAARCDGGTGRELRDGGVPEAGFRGAECPRRAGAQGIEAEILFASKRL